MPYGQKKMTSVEAVDGILESIRNSLLQNDAFSSNSIGYFGVELEYEIRLRLHSRGAQETTVAPPATLIGPDGEQGAKTDEKPAEVKVEGKKVAGRVPEKRGGALKNAPVKDRAGIAGPKAD